MRRPYLLFAAVLFALLAGLATLPVLIELPARTATPMPGGEFNEVRAKARLAAILGDQRSHPADSFGDDAVRTRLIARIRALGLTPIVRDRFACSEIYKKRGVTCARVRNLLVALGPAAGKAVLLNAHYDSNPAGPGASDDGAGVATLLEIAAILKNERLERPVLLLFNEGEELGLVGARAFLADPLSKRVDSLINVEARGVTGPVTMFETSDPNGPAVRAFARSVDRPYANSLATDFYRLLPNYTDVNAFAERGWTTLNFAMIGNETRYHSAGDDLEALDSRSLKHMGDQALALARELAGASPGAGGAVIFADLAGRWLVVLPVWMGIGLLTVLVAGLAFVSLKRGETRRGLLVITGALIGSALIAWLCLFLVGLARPGTFWRAYPLWAHLAVYACGLLAAVAALAWPGRRLTIAQLRSSFWLCFVLIGVAVLAIATGGIVYFLLPPLVVLAGFVAGHRFPAAERVGSILAALLLWLTLGEAVALLRELLNNGPMFVFAPLALLIAMPWLIEAKPLLDGLPRPRAVAMAATLMLAGWAVAASMPAYSKDRQQRWVIQHVTNTVTGRAYWSVLNDRKPPPRNYGGTDGWRRTELPWIENKRWVAPAPAVQGTEAPRIHVVGNSRRSRFRTVAFTIEPNGAQSVALIGTKDAGIVSAGSGDFVRPIQPDAKGDYYLTCFGRSCAGAVMRFTTTVRQPTGFTLIGSRPGLPPVAAPLVGERPRFARPQYVPDSTMTMSRIWL